MKVVFLDIDGVLNHSAFLKHMPRNFSDLDMIDPKAVQLLNKLLEDTGANIVISSSWRIGHTVVHLQQLLTGAGLLFPERVIGTTTSRSNLERGAEINIWLKQVPVDGFVILDDDCDMNPLMDHLVQTDFEKGLQPEDIEKAKEILG